MSGDLNKIAVTKSMTSKYDNTEYVQENEARDVAVAYSSLEAMKVQHAYLENLKTQHELLKSAGDSVKMYIRNPKDGSLSVTDVPLKEVMPIPTEFESVRFGVMRELNKLASGGEADQARLRESMLRFETDSIFELSERIANRLIDKKRKDAEDTKFKGIIA